LLKTHVIEQSACIEQPALGDPSFRESFLSHGQLLITVWLSSNISFVFTTYILTSTRLERLR